jgi:hypothetical protein
LTAAVSSYTAEPCYKSDRCYPPLCSFLLTLFPHSLPFPHPPSSIPEIKNTPNDFYDKNKTERMGGGGERKKRKKKKDAATHIKKFFSKLSIKSLFFL